MSVQPALPAAAEDPVFAMHRGGKISVRPAVDVTDRQGLAMAYTPGVARVCTAIAEAPELDITESMKLATADAIAALVGPDAAPGYVIPSQFDPRVAPAVAAAVAAQSRADGVARR
jgi:malic enzyme